MKKDFEIKCKYGVLRVTLDFAPNEEALAAIKESDEIEDFVVNIDAETGEIQIKGGVLKDVEFTDLTAKNVLEDGVVINDGETLDEKNVLDDGKRLA